MEKTLAAHYGCIRAAHAAANPAREPKTPAEPDGMLDVRGRPRRVVTTIRERHRAVQALLVASTLLSSLLLYAGFHLPLHFSTHALLTNTADMIRLILRDKAVHGYCSGYKYQRGLEKLDAAGQEEMRTIAYDLLEELYQLELQ
ncbi:ribonucleotide-diphosphate reductase subunit beta [Streptomyces sp. NPDC057545]|uniref:ribonucleotide-diphosphate reductase subunit beta n=1 Tax=unclassified Streptomyces TaxID=2593676 RepID=UPI003699417E